MCSAMLAKSVHFVFVGVFARIAMIGFGYYGYYGYQIVTKNYIANPGNGVYVNVES